MNAEIIAVGSEMLTPSRMDTNSLWLTAQLNDLGIEVVAKSIVGDDRARLAGMIRDSLHRAELLLISGGLGPTEDDLTRESVADALGLALDFRQDALDAIAERFARMNRRMAENNRRQAFILNGAEMLANPRGTAPGQWLVHGARALALLPGPPNELKGMYQDHILDRVRRLAPPLVIRTREYRIAGMGESDLDQLIAPVYKQYANPVTTVLAKPGDVQVHLRARCADAAEAEALVSELGEKVKALLGDRVYSEDGASLEIAVGRMLAARGESLAVAESCTGGMLGERITSVPGSSEYFRGGFLVYTEEMKIGLLGISPDLIAEMGAVSDEVAIGMARGARERTGSTHAIAITGYAGPDGGTPETPTGTVCIGYAGPAGETSRRIQFTGDRARVRSLAAQSALDLLRKKLASTGSAT
jgi:nicotinamide-nucleotide amidase